MEYIKTQLETERLVLRPWKREDIDAYAGICADEKVMYYLGGKVFNRLETWRHMAMLIGHWMLRGYGHWAVEEKETGMLIGRVGFLNPDGYPGFEIGWTLSSKVWGKGYATEAAKCALDFAFNELNQTEVISLISPTNKASIRIAEKIGEEFIREDHVMGFDVLVYSISKEKYMQVNKN